MQCSCVRYARNSPVLVSLIVIKTLLIQRRRIARVDLPSTRGPAVFRDYKMFFNFFLSISRFSIVSAYNPMSLLSRWTFRQLIVVRFDFIIYIAAGSYAAASTYMHVIIYVPTKRQACKPSSPVLFI